MYIFWFENYQFHLICTDTSVSFSITQVHRCFTGRVKDSGIGEIDIDGWLGAGGAIVDYTGEVVDGS